MSLLIKGNYLYLFYLCIVEFNIIKRNYSPSGLKPKVFTNSDNTGFLSFMIS